MKCYEIVDHANNYKLLDQNIYRFMTKTEAKKLLKEIVEELTKEHPEYDVVKENAGKTTLSCKGKVKFSFEVYEDHENMDWLECYACRPFSLEEMKEFAEK